MYACRNCEEPINTATEICPHCGTDLTVPPPEEIEIPKRKPSLLKAAVYWALILAGLWGVFWFAVPQRFSNSGGPESAAIDALRELRTALASYQQAAGAFPASLESLGDAARGPAQRALSAGYQLQYSPAPAGLDGRIHGYSLIARPGNFGFRNFCADESGVIRATHDDRAATPRDPPI